jgi:hypothetical protein
VRSGKAFYYSSATCSAPDERRRITRHGRPAPWRAARRRPGRLEGQINGDTLRVERDYTRGVPSIMGEYPFAALNTEFLAAYRPGEIVAV